MGSAAVAEIRREVRQDSMVDKRWVANRLAKDIGDVAMTMERFRELCREEIQMGGDYRLRIMGWGEMRQGIWWYQDFQQAFPLEDGGEIVSEEEHLYLASIIMNIASRLHRLKDTESIGLPAAHHLIERVMWEVGLKGGKDVMEHWVWKNGKAALMKLIEDILVRERLLKPDGIKQ